MTRFKLKEVNGKIEIVSISEQFAHPKLVAVKIKDVIDILDNNDYSYVLKVDKHKFLQLLLDRSIDIGTI